MIPNKQMPRASDFRKDLSDLLQARIPVIQIVTYEEDRAVQEVRTVAKSLNKKLLFWSASKGTHEDNPTKSKSPAFTMDLAAAIETFERKSTGETNYLFVLLDPNPYFKQHGSDPAHIRRLKEFAIAIRTEGLRANCLMISSDPVVPRELEKHVTVIDFPLPTRAEIKHYVQGFVGRLGKTPSIKIGGNGTLVDSLVDASLGLTSMEIEQALARAVVDDHQLDFSDVKRIHAQKQQIIRKSGILEYLDTRDLTLGEVGGLEMLKGWLQLRTAAFSEEGQAYGIKNPKGVLLTGVPGCGKSLSAKCVAASWGLPLIRLDMGKIYSSLVGSSEGNMRDAIKTCESVAPCVLWIDEIEKGIPRDRAGVIGDSGVSLRVLGSFLTWMQEKTSSVFVFATANEIHLLAPEVLRKGRFDEIFFVDLPNEQERREILGIHLRKIGREPGNYDLDELVRLSGPDNLGEETVMTGAEIEAWVNEALINSFHGKKGDAGKRELSMEDFRFVIQRLVPLARLRKPEIQKLREWANTHALSASVPTKRAEQEPVFGGRLFNLWDTPDQDDASIPVAPPHIRQAVKAKR
jgi:ATP-dependent 26S proteasome regulatory subunit